MPLNETDYNYDIFLEFHHFDKKGYFTPPAYHYIINSMVDKHLMNYNIHFEKLFPSGVSWVILSLTIDIINPIKNREQKLIGKTWFSGRKGVVFRRQVQLHSEDGTHILNATLYSTLIDLNTRSVYRSRELPFELVFPTENELMIAKPTFKEKFEYEFFDNNKVKKSYLDMVGHVNNLKYSEFCYDAMNDIQANLEKIKRMEIYFVSELKNADEFNLNKTMIDDKLIIQGYNKTNDKPSFYGVFYYED